jgi:DNA-binding XRE family transcriptional regulator
MEEEKYLTWLGGKIAEMRKNNGDTQENLSEKIGINRSALARIEVGKTNCSIVLIRKIAAALGVTASDLISED